jgi:hypothetical protein
MKFWAGRGQQYCSLLFWAFTMSQLVLMNLREYVILSFFQYVLSCALMIAGIFLFVLFVGFLDTKTRILEHEQGYQFSHNPVMMETLKNTRELLINKYSTYRRQTDGGSVCLKTT